jgi:hypothetical protein
LLAVVLAALADARRFGRGALEADAVHHDIGTLPCLFERYVWLGLEVGNVDVVRRPLGESDQQLASVIISCQTGGRMAAETGSRKALRLTWLDLLLIGVLAIASLWIGEAAATGITQRMMRDPAPDISFRIRHHVPQAQESVAALEEQLKGLREELSKEQVSLIEDRQKLTQLPGNEASTLWTEIGARAQLIRALQLRQLELLGEKGRSELALAAAQQVAQENQARSTTDRKRRRSLARAILSIGVLVLLSSMLYAVRRWAGAEIHFAPVAIGAALVLVALLIGAFAGWVAVAALAVTALLLIPGGARNDVV